MCACAAYLSSPGLYGLTANSISRPPFVQPSIHRPHYSTGPVPFSTAPRKTGRISPSRPPKPFRLRVLCRANLNRLFEVLCGDVLHIAAFRRGRRREPKSILPYRSPSSRMRLLRRLFPASSKRRRLNRAAASLAVSKKRAPAVPHFTEAAPFRGGAPSGSMSSSSFVLYPAN